MVTDYEGCFIEVVNFTGTKEEAKREAEDLKRKLGGQWTDIRPIEEHESCKR